MWTKVSSLRKQRVSRDWVWYRNRDSGRVGLLGSRATSPPPSSPFTHLLAILPSAYASRRVSAHDYPITVRSLAAHPQGS